MSGSTNIAIQPEDDFEYVNISFQIIVLNRFVCVGSIWSFYAIIAEIFLLILMDLPTKLATSVAELWQPYNNTLTVKKANNLWILKAPLRYRNIFKNRYLFQCNLCENWLNNFELYLTRSEHPSIHPTYILWLK